MTDTLIAETPGYIPATRLTDTAAQAGRDAIAHVMATVCRQCGRKSATDADWDTVHAGERPDLCWDGVGNCMWSFGDVPPITAQAAQAYLDAVLPSLEATIRSSERAHHHVMVNP